MGTPTVRTLRPAVLLIAFGAALPALPSSASGQVRIHGRAIADRTGAPIEGVAVSVLDADGEELETAVTGSAGRFVFRIPGTPEIRLRGERIGYETVTTPSVDLERFRSLTVELRLNPDVVPVAPLEVVASQRADPNFLHDGFQHRKKRGFGQYVTRAEIERRNPSHVTDLLRTMAGVSLSTSGRGSHGVVTTNRGRSSFAGSCPAQIYVDNFHINRASGRTFRIDDIVSPDDVAGIEVYRGLSTVPAEFLSPRADCGVIVIWTRRSSG